MSVKSANRRIPAHPALPHYLFAWAVGGNYDSQGITKIVVGRPDARPNLTRVEFTL